MPSNEDLEKFTKIELIAFLKSRGVGHTGNRSVSSFAGGSDEVVGVVVDPCEDVVIVVDVPSFVDFKWSLMNFCDLEGL